MKSALIYTLSDVEKLIASFTYLNSFEALIENIKKQIDIVAKNDTTGLYLFSKEENKLKLFYAKGFSEQEKQEAELTAMARHPGHVFTTGNILWVADQDKQDNKFSIDSRKKSHTRSRLYVPVKANNLIIGAFGIQSEMPNAFTEKHLAVLQVFAALAGNAYFSIQNNLLIKKQNEENEQLSILARTTTNNVIYTDKDGKITWVNKNFEETTGYFLDEIIGKTPGSFLIGKDTDAEKTNELRTAILNKKACKTTILNYKKNGEPFIVAIQLNPVFNKTGDLINFVAIQEDITESEKQKYTVKHQNEQLKLQAHLYDNLVNTTSDFIVALDKNGQIKFANKSWLEKMNYQLDEVIETNIFNYMHPDSQEHCMLIFNNLHNGKNKSFLIQYDLINKNKEKIEVEGEVSLTYKDDEIHSINSYLKDVTEINKLRIEKEYKIVELQQNKKRLENVLGSLSESVWGVSLPNYKLEYVSESAVSIYGYPLQNWYDNINLWSDSIHPEDKEFVLKESEKLFDVGHFLAEYRIITANKKEKWIYSETKIITSEEGIPILMAGITRDITKNKNAEIEIKRLKIFYETILNHLPSDIAIFDKDHKYLYVNKIAIKDATLREYIIGKDDFEYAAYRGRDSKGAIERRAKFIESKESKMMVTWEDEINFSNKQTITMLRKFYPVIENENDLNLMIGYGVDITSIKENQLKVIKNEAKINLIMRSALDAILIINSKGIITFTNPAVFEVFGFSEQELLNTRLTDNIMPTRHAAEYPTGIPNYSQSGKSIILNALIELPAIRKGGSEILIELSNIPIEIDGEASFCLFTRDITKKKEAEIKIADLNKNLEEKVRQRTTQLEVAIKELDSFSYSVSHDLKAPLRGIAGYSSALLEDYRNQLDEEGVRFINKISESTTFMNRLIDDLLTLSKIGRYKLSKTSVQLTELSKDIFYRILETHSRNDVKLKIEDNLILNCDKNLFTIVLTNLISNAIKFSSKKAAPIVEIGSMADPAGTIFYIKDNGAGFDLQFAEKLFGAFQRLHTKSEFEGTGIGLATVMRIINMHEGKIWTDSKVDEGATFFFQL